jgi:hypothetical protein
LTSIFVCGFCASALFGRVIVSTPFEKSGATIDARRQVERALKQAAGTLGPHREAERAPPRRLDVEHAAQRRKPKPLPNRSNSRAISPRKECHTSGTLVCAGAVFFTSTGTSAIAVSIVSQQGGGFFARLGKVRVVARSNIDPRNRSGGEEEK